MSLTIIPTQNLQLEELIASEHLTGHVLFDPVTSTIFRVVNYWTVWWFEIGLGNKGGYVVRFAPGSATPQEMQAFKDWREVLVCFRSWLVVLKRERAALERSSLTADAPEWVYKLFPAEFDQLQIEIEERKNKLAEIGARGELLWQQGEALDRAIVEVFREFGYKADQTKPGETYDVTVNLDTSRRLLIEVTGTKGVISKGSAKISQLLQIQQTIAKQVDTIVLAANVQMDKPLNERSAEIATPDALPLIVMLDAALTTTATLYQLWLKFRDDPAAARSEVERLYNSRGKTFAL